MLRFVVAEVSGRGQKIAVIFSGDIFWKRHISIQVSQLRRRRSKIAKNLFYWQWIKQYGQIFSFGLLPHRKPINVVIGSPIKVKEAIKDPTDDEVSLKT